MKNPIEILDSILADWASPRVRRLVHGLILLALAVTSVILAAEGDWKIALGTLVVGAYAAANRANTPVSGNHEGENGS